jgi:hypothetical protein
MYRGADYPDMSEYVVHFTKPSEPGTPGRPGATAYENSLSILYDRHLKPGGKAFGTAADRHLGLGWVGDMRRAVCFSEVPLPYAGRVARRNRSQYGVGFHKDFVVANRGAPVWYLEKGSAHEEAWLLLQAEHAKRRDPAEVFWPLATCVDQVGERWVGRFDWEREWRIPGPDGLRFKSEDVALLFLPGELHAAARGFFEDAVEENTGPGYFCAYIDPLWQSDQIAAALTASPPPRHGTAAR